MYEVGVAATIITSLALVAVGTVIGISQFRSGRTGVSGAWFFIITCFTLAMWLFANILSDADPSRALLWVRVSFASVAVALTSLLLFVNRFPARRSASYTETAILIIALAVMLALIASPLVIPTVVFESIVSTVVPGPLYGAFIVFVMYMLGASLFRLFKGAHLKKHYRDQVRPILIGVVITAAVALVTNLLLPLILGNNNLYWLASVSTLSFVIATAYAIAREGLFDVRHAVMRSMTYLAALATIITIYYGLVSFASHTLLRDQRVVDAAVSPLAILPALVFIFTFQPVKRFFDRLTNNLFFRDSYKSEEFFAEFGHLLTSTIDLRGLLVRASNQIATTFKAEQAFFYLSHVSAAGQSLSAGTDKHARLPIQDVELLEGFFHDGRNTIVLTDFIGNQKVQRMLRSHRVALVMPLYHSDRIIGYVMIGDHLSGHYTERDLTVLSSVSNELVIAIQNALSLHEVKELNATLQQRIDVATKELRSSNAQLKHLDEVKDEFMSMASHQLRTPLTSIKGYLSMALEGDAGKVTPQQEKLLTEAFNSSERMVQLISDFLNISRLQTGKFVIDKAPMDIKQTVRQEVSNLKLLAEGRGLKLRLDVTDKDLPVVADESKIRQVIMNFIDNAVFYSTSKGTIVMRLERVGNSMAFTVTDSGIGVPEDQQGKLFSKFFRAKNARKQRPDGTGVGLYLAKKVVDGHNGSIIFSSKEGRGSTFGFRLPLDHGATK